MSRRGLIESCKGENTLMIGIHQALEIYAVPNRAYEGGRYCRNNRPFYLIYATITSMIAGLSLRLASRPRFISQPFDAACR